MDMIRWHQDQDGVVVLTIDDPEQSANTMNQRFIASLQEAVQRLESERD
jgi:3-hydroxyacyl-CoA dehydrogenase/enoyl-CoA hydratase/3-hydroxybutyryl-CoA epimerase